MRRDAARPDASAPSSDGMRDAAAGILFPRLFLDRSAGLNGDPRHRAFLKSSFVMPTSSLSRASDTSDLERLAEAIKLAVERLRAQAESVRERMDSDVQIKRVRDQLAGVEEALTRLKAYLPLDPAEIRVRMQEGRRERNAIRAELAELRESYLRKQQRMLGDVRNAERLLRNYRRAKTEQQQLEALLPTVELTDVLSFFSPVELDLLRELRARRETLKDAPPQGVAAEEEPDLETLFAPYLPKPSPLTFAEEDKDIVTRLARGEFASQTAQKLNRMAQEVSLLGGFEVLLGLQSVRNVVEYPHQINTVRQVLRRFHGRALLCDEAGLGKTIEAGLVLKEYLVRGLVRKVLILTPPALVSQWREEMSGKLGLEFITPDSPEFKRAGADAWTRFNRVIASLTTATRSPQCERITAQEYDLLVVDEAHHVTNRASQAWKFVNRLREKYLLLLTATPVQNDLDELYNLIVLLKPGQLKTPAEFRRRFVARDNGRRPRDRMRLRELLMDVMIRTTRAQANLLLPPRHARTERIRLSGEEADLYRAVTRFVREHYAAGRQRFPAQTLQAEVGSSPQAVASTLAALAGKEGAAKAELAALHEQALAVTTPVKENALVRLLQQDPQKLIVFTKYRETQARLVTVLRAADIPVARFDGSLTAAEKDAELTRFATDTQVLVSTDVGSGGRNLQFCRALVNYDLPWNPVRLEQRVGPIQRIGQTEPVLIISFSVTGTIESHILRILTDKVRLFELVAGEMSMILGNLDSEREFEDLALEAWLAAEDETAAQQRFDELGRRLMEARKRYLETKEYDEHLFGDEFAPDE